MEKVIKIPAEVYSRVSGFYRPVIQWNRGKKEEFRERKTYTINIKSKEFDKKNSAIIPE